MPFPNDFHSAFGIIAILGILQIPLLLFFRRQAQLNPARQMAFSEPVVFQAHITTRSRLPTRLWRPNHWYFARSNMVDIFVRTSTVQVSSSILRRQGRRYGWFLKSSTTTMWLSSMRPYLMSSGQQQCIVLSGSFPFRGQDREVQLAIFSRDRTREIWDALATSGVRGLAAPNGEEAPARALQTVSSSPSWGPTITAPGPPVPPSPPVSAIPQSYAPHMQAPYTPEFAPPSRRRLWPFVVVGLFVCSPLLLGVILSHVSKHQSDFAVVVSGPSNVATVSNVACVPSESGEVGVSGTITAVANAPLGLTIHASMENLGGVPIGSGGFAAVLHLNQGQSEVFQSNFNDYGAENPDRCVITWSANTPG
jgi:hypothetical protein